MENSLSDLNKETREAWDMNAEIWDKRMGNDGNDFFNVLCWPALASLLDLKPDSHILDIACGNGLTTRRLAEFGATVTAFDFSSKLIEYARERTAQYKKQITYHTIDATDESQLLGLGKSKFDLALSNMALFDMAEIEPLFRTLPKLLKPGGAFIFSITHPAFNNASSMHIVEELDDNGTIKTTYSIKVSRYMNTYHMRGLALRSQPKPQVYFERPLQYYINMGLQNGFVLDGFEERAFPPDIPQMTPLGWGGKFSELPAAIVIRMRLK
jgi:2-polyprenyl-3-methyl-5-hydroxy-6-metoxy-1,4-benzoquinol methylase